MTQIKKKYEFKDHLLNTIDAPLMEPEHAYKTFSSFLWTPFFSYFQSKTNPGGVFTSKKQQKYEVHTLVVNYL